MKRVKNKIESFWKALPEDTTIEELAEGLIVNFEFEGKLYEVNTKVSTGFRCRSMDSAYESWDRLAQNAEVKEKLNDNK